MDKPSVQFKSLILCEDIRREDNGKLIFIGVYSENVLVHRFPSSLFFSFWMPAETNIQENIVEIDISLKPFSKGKKRSVAKGEMLLNVPGENFKKGKANINLWMGRLQVDVEEESLLIVSGKVPGGRFREIGRRDIIKNPSR